MAAQQSSNRVFMLAVDAVSLSYIREHADELPTLRALLAGGALQETQSTADLLSASVWPTFMAGSLPGEHGHYFPFQWRAEDMRSYRPINPIMVPDLRFEPFWYTFAQQGIPCVAFDLPDILKCSEAPLPQVTNWSTQDSGQCETSDPGFLRTLRRRFGHRPIGKEVPVPKDKTQSDAIARHALQSLATKMEAIAWCMRERPWRFFLAGVHDLHRAGHNLWPVEEDYASDVSASAMHEIYKAFDGHLAGLLEQIDLETTSFILFSVHGMGPNRAQGHFLQPLLDRLNTLYFAPQQDVTARPTERNTVQSLMKRVPPRLQYTAAHLLGEHVQDWVVNRAYTAGLDWSKTAAFMVPTAGELAIRFNIKGREAKGCLSPQPDQIAAYESWLCDQLRALTVPRTGKPFIQEIVRLRDHWPGARSHYLPDLVAVSGADRPETEIASPQVGRISASIPTGRGGNHTGESFCLVAGRRPSDLPLDHLVTIADYPPIISHLLNVA